MYIYAANRLVFLQEDGAMGKESSCGDSFRKDDAQEAALGWDSLQRLPTYQRARIALLHGVTGDLKEIDLQKLDVQETKELLNRVVRNPEDNEEYLLKLKNRIDRVSLCLPTIEVRFQNLNISGEAYLGERASPSLFNYFLNIAESVAKWLHLCSNRKQKFSILCDASGIIKPGRMTLLLGPPGSGKTTLLKALSGKFDSQLQFSGRVTYNGHEMKEFVPQRTAAYISQYDIHLPLMTVRETLMFSARCQGIGTTYDMLIELLRKEKEMNIKPDPYIDALMKASVLKGQKEDIVTEYILKVCPETPYLTPTIGYGKSQTVYPHQKTEKKKNLEMVRVEKGHVTEETNASFIRSKTDNSPTNSRVDRQNSQRMLLPFTPLYLTFENVKYSVDVPKEMKAQGASGGRLDILKGVSGAFRPGVLTALMGISGAGKTTLLDVLAGRKNSGYIEGSIRISGFPKKQETFAQISGYCEQNDIHSPYLTVYESLIFSAWLRLPSEVDSKTLELFVEEIIELIELTPLRDSLVGFPHVNGLSIEQRKRLTIAVELVANPSIIFLDEPTSGLDARAAAIVMRAVRNTVDTGRTVVCTIHQPSIDIFESFDEDIPGVDSIRDGYNPATWVLDMTTAAKEEALGIKFADVYKKSDLFRQNEALIRELSAPPPDAQALHFPSKYPRSYLTQFKACLWKQHKSFFRNTSYNAVRMLFSASMGLLFGAVFLRLGSKRSTKQEIFNSVGAMYIAINFMGTQGSLTVQPVLITERTVYYRERAAGMYSALPHAFAQVAIEFPYTLVQVALYAVIVYAMMGYEWTASKFLLNYFFMFITILYFIYYGMVVVAVSPNQATASMLTGFSYSVWNLFTGFVIPRTRISVWWRWYAWICPVSWSLYGTTKPELADPFREVQMDGIAGNVQISCKSDLNRISSLCKDGELREAVESLIWNYEISHLDLMYTENSFSAAFTREFIAKNDYVGTKLVVFYSEFDDQTKLGIEIRIGFHEEASVCSCEMHEIELVVDNFVIPISLKVSGVLQWIPLGKAVHGCAIKMGRGGRIDIAGKCV
ncbi:ABC transporter G family member 36, partial [Cucurbita argyrosperma subsp. sororia]